MNFEEKNNVLDLSNKGLKKLPKIEGSKNVKVLILDENEFQKIENIDNYLAIEKLSLRKNSLLRMYGVSRLHVLKELNLSHNAIIGIEALKECIHLTHLNLEGNQIKTIEHLNTNMKLEYLNLGDNSIGVINDLSFLKHLKELYLHKNKINHLRSCDRFLPPSLEILSLDRNQVTDLNEIHTLSNLTNLTSINFSDNPCVQMTGGNSIGFDYRPFLLNWCMSVKIIDNFVVNPIESLKAEWLFSQGKGRSFRVGDQKSLAQYLSQVCQLNLETLEDENERKLRLILSKAQQHQRQLQEQICSGNASPANNASPGSISAQNSPSSSRKKTSSKLQSPRGRMSGANNRPLTADSVMTSSYSFGTAIHNDLNNTMSQLDMTRSLTENFTNDLMTKSLDPSLLDTSSLNISSVSEIIDAPPAVKQLPSSSVNNLVNNMNNNGNFYNEQPNSVPTQFPMVTASKMMPIPESLMSPDCAPPFPLTNQQQTLTHKPKPITTGKPQPSKLGILQRPSSSPANSAGGGGKSQKAVKKSSEKSPTLSPKKKIIEIEKNDKISRVAKHIEREIIDDIEKSTMESGEKPSKVIENREIENSATVIQKLWRGYCVRKMYNQKISEELHQKRTQDYITKLTKDMEVTKQALENERKIQQLQMQAINALWKKVSHMQLSENPMKDISNNNLSGNDLIHDLVKTCNVLTNQVQQLQSSMQEILNCMAIFSSQLPNRKEYSCDSAETQTEIVAVRTPESDFPFPLKLVRPCTLPINECKNDSK